MSVETEDLDGEVISINGESAGNDEPLTGSEDRGDIVDPELSTENLKQLVKDTPADPVEDEAKPKVIPKARFDEVNEAKKAAQAQLDAALAEIAALKAAPAPKAEPIADSFDEDAKEGEYIEAMLDGDTAKAKEIRKEINTNLRNQAAQQVQASMKQQEVATTMQAESSKALEDYPYLDTPDGELALSLIVAARNADIAKGVPAHLALRKAVAAIAPKFMPEDDTPSRELPQSKPQSDTRTQEALRRGASDSLRQPPQVQAGIGNRTTQARVDVENLDDDQFANLSAAEKKRLRGD